MKAKEDFTAYKAALENESIFDVAVRCKDFRDAKATMPEMKLVDAHYQYLFDRVIDSLIVTYDSGGINATINGLRDGMHRRRGPSSKQI